MDLNGIGLRKFGSGIRPIRLQYPAVNAYYFKLGTLEPIRLWTDVSFDLCFCVNTKLEHGNRQTHEAPPRIVNEVGLHYEGFVAIQQVLKLRVRFSLLLARRQRQLFFEQL